MAQDSTSDQQAFPILSTEQMALVQRFGLEPPRPFAEGATVYAVGAPDAPAWFILDGSIDVVSRGGLIGERAIVTLWPGQFSGEMSQLANRPTMAGGRAGPQGCLAVPLDAARLRGLIIGSAELGEIIMRALILRRTALIGAGGSGAVLIGQPDDPAMLRLRGFLTRNGYPHLALDATLDGQASALVSRLGAQQSELPLSSALAATRCVVPVRQNLHDAWA